MCVLLLGGERVGGRRDSDCEEITDEPSGCGICGKEGGEDCESEGHSYDRVIIELQMDVDYTCILNLNTWRAMEQH